MTGKCTLYMYIYISEATQLNRHLSDMKIVFLLISANHVMIDIFNGNGTKKDILVPTYV